MNEQNLSWIKNTAEEAAKAAHVFPQMAACEAALESAFGKSTLAQEGDNLFGMKQHSHPIYGTLTLPTKEFENSAWKVIEGAFVKYPTLAACFDDRMATLVRLKSVYIHYGLALAAKDPVTYVTEVSTQWSTDPKRAASCIAIYNEYFG
jgi:flagellum-specific peptidoglycan hydrolase FlgJ